MAECMAVIIPFQPIAAPKKSDDGERIRVDSCQWVDFHGGPVEFKNCLQNFSYVHQRLPVD